MNISPTRAIIILTFRPQALESLCIQRAGWLDRERYQGVDSHVEATRHIRGEGEPVSERKLFAAMGVPE